MIRKLLSGLSAGILISIGGAVYLACENKYVGAALFSVALLCICYKGYALYTGRVVYLPEKHDREAFSSLFLGLAGNAAGTVVCGLAVRYALPKLGETAEALCGGKLAQIVPQTLIRAFFCGALMYLAVSIFRYKKTPVAILFCIPVFILSGFEHSIADIFYFAAGGLFTLPVLGFVCAVILGNSVGGVLLPILVPDKKPEETDK